MRNMTTLKLTKPLMVKLRTIKAIDEYPTMEMLLKALVAVYEETPNAREVATHANTDK